MFRPRVILFPTDLTPTSAHALPAAADLARQYGARLLVLYVAETLGPANVTYGEAESVLEPEGYRRRLVEEVRKSTPVPADVPAEILLTEGDAAREILHTAASRACDLIVMSTHGLTGLRRLLAGSVAEKVVREAPCPVLTVRPPP
jgi:nucleotide-binding universal stress UspA family protein